MPCMLSAQLSDKNIDTWNDKNIRHHHFSPHDDYRFEIERIHFHNTDEINIILFWVNEQ